MGSFLKSLFFAQFLICLTGLTQEFKPDFAQVGRDVGGVVLAYSPAQSGIYVGSPALCILDDGTYLAMHDFFGKESRKIGEGRSEIYASKDGGKTWEKVARFNQYFASFFVHKGDAYIFGLDTATGLMHVRKSVDGGKTWTQPADENTGVIERPEKGFIFHCAPTPFVKSGGRIYRGLELKKYGSKWEDPLYAVCMSADENADLLKASSWTFSNRVCIRVQMANFAMANLLECNAVVDAESGEVFLMPRITSGGDDLSCLIKVSEEGKKITLDPDDAFRMPGAGKKFTVHYDEKTRKYWALTNYIPEEFRGRARNGKMRNTIALVSCGKLGKAWRVESIVLQSQNNRYRGFQYIDWLFDGDDIVALSRTAAYDGESEAHNQHDANFLTFHRITNFRQRNMESGILNEN